MPGDAELDVEIETDPALGFEHRQLVDLFSYWNSKRGPRSMPARADVDALDLKQNLGYIYLVDVEGPPYRFRYRLVGTKLTAILRRDVTGLYFEEVYPDPLRQRLIDIYSGIATRRAPLRTHGQGRYPNGRSYRFETLNLPLSEDGERVNMVLCAVVLTPADGR